MAKRRTLTMKPVRNRGRQSNRMLHQLGALVGRLRLVKVKRESSGTFLLIFNQATGYSSAVSNFDFGAFMMDGNNPDTAMEVDFNTIRVYQGDSAVGTTWTLDANSGDLRGHVVNGDTWESNVASTGKLE